MSPILKLVIGRLFACFGLLLFAAGPAPAQAAVRPVLYQFTANCEDCAAAAHTPDYIVHGQLVLDEYELGTMLMDYQFVSFTYDGSNLFQSFTVDAADLAEIFGALPAALPGAPASPIAIVSTRPFVQGGLYPTEEFIIRDDGTWELGNTKGDQGDEASFAVPEPSTWAMMLLGLAGLGYAARLGARKRSGAAAVIAGRQAQTTGSRPGVDSGHRAESSGIMKSIVAARAPRETSMNPKWRLGGRRLLACVGVLLFAAHPARAIIAIPTTTYEFAANCVDCAAKAGTSDYIVHGQLVLTDVYVLGTTILPTEFVSFTYDGSNLYHSFTIDSKDLLTIFGALPSVLPGPPARNVVIISKYPFGAPGNNTFQINASGTWFLGQPTDFGNEASFAVPEPSTWAMMLLGFAGLGYAGRRNARKRRAIA